MAGRQVSEAGRVSAVAAPFTNLVLFVTVVAAVLMALSLSMPWYHKSVDTGEGYWYSDYEMDYYFEYAVRSNGLMYDYDWEGALEEVMDVEKTFVYAWICLLFVFMGTVMLDGRYSSIAASLALTAVSLAALMFFAAKIEEVAGEVVSGSAGTDWTVTRTAGTGLVAALVAFVAQSLAIFLRARYVLPWIVEDIKVNRSRAA